MDPVRFSQAMDDEMAFMLACLGGLDPDAVADMKMDEAHEMLLQKAEQLDQLVLAKEQAAESATSAMMAQVEKPDLLLAPQDRVKDLTEELESLKITKNNLIKALGTGKLERQVQSAKKAELISKLHQLRPQLKQAPTVGFSYKNPGLHP